MDRETYLMLWVFITPLAIVQFVFLTWPAWEILSERMERSAAVERFERFERERSE